MTNHEKIFYDLVWAVREHDAKLNAAEIAPTADDYNEIWAMVEYAATLAGLTLDKPK